MYGHIPRGVPKDFGFCPQADVLWPKLTVKQHMQFYANLKGLPMSDADIYHVLDELNIPHDIDRLAGSLSHTGNHAILLHIFNYYKFKLTEI